jgi:hypothetical protein
VKALAGRDIGFGERGVSSFRAFFAEPALYNVMHRAKRSRHSLIRAR